MCGTLAQDNFCTCLWHLGTFCRHRKEESNIQTKLQDGPDKFGETARNLPFFYLSPSAPSPRRQSDAETEYKARDYRNPPRSSLSLIRTPNRSRQQKSFAADVRWSHIGSAVSKHSFDSMWRKESEPLHKQTMSNRDPFKVSSTRWMWPWIAVCVCFAKVDKQTYIGKCKCKSPFPLRRHCNRP